MPTNCARIEGDPDAPFLGGRVRLRQSDRGHRAGTDAVLLAAAAPLIDGLIMDAGSGVGAVGISAALRMPQARVDLLEIDAACCALARENLALNGLEPRGRVITVDLMTARSRRAAGVLDGSAELVLVNPPFYEADRVRASPHPDRARAHVLPGAETLADWIKMATALADADGCVLAIHRADRLDALLAACAGRLGALSILPVHPREYEPASRVLVGGRKGSRAPLRLLPGLTLHRADGAFTSFADAVHRGEAIIALF